MSDYPPKAALGATATIKFPDLAQKYLNYPQLRSNLTRATGTIRAKRAGVVAEVPAWEEMRQAAAEIKDFSIANLDTLLRDLEATVTAHGGKVHFALDADEANRIVVEIARSHRFTEAIKVKSITTDEIGLNDALQAAGITAYETDLAELIVQLAHEMPSHILVPAIHKNRDEIRALFARTIADDSLGSTPKELAEAARLYLREKFLTVPFAVSGANFAVASSGAVAVVESEGNGRMCLTLPKVLVTVMGIEKVIPDMEQLPLFLELLARSSTGERMNPYTSIFSGVHPGDGPEEFHLILLDNNRSSLIAHPLRFQTLRCIRCSACLNACPVYERASGFAYGSVYQGPIGAILVPQLIGVEKSGSLAFASTLCGACYEVCPVKINIPAVLTSLRATYNQSQASSFERVAFGTAAKLMSNPRSLRWGSRLVLRLAPRFAKMPLSWQNALPILGRWTRWRAIPLVRLTKEFRSVGGVGRDE